LNRTALGAYPNPFNPATTIEYDVDVPGLVSVAVYDVAGHLVDTIVHEEFRAPGHYTMPYAPRGASGVYFVRLRTAGVSHTAQIVMLK
jgi:hypothetical protein